MTENHAPYWKGFNLPSRFARDGRRPFHAEDFALLAEWGFNWVRLPLAYTSWIDDNDPYRLHEDTLKEIDYAVELGRQHGIHVNIAFHRSPGYQVNRKADEGFNLWKDQAALDACTFHWVHFARRYKGVSGELVSFNLWNEPPFEDPAIFTRQDHERVTRHVVAAIREVDLDRPIVLDGMQYGVLPFPELADLGCIQSCRGYFPLQITHHKATWVHEPVTQEPAWPITVNGRFIDKAALEAFYQPWVELMAKGVSIHCGEFGVLKHTPHPITLAWLEDLLKVFHERRIGYGLWNLRGSFGVLDSDRADVNYEDFRGHKLDRAMLELLRKY